MVAVRDERSAVDLSADFDAERSYGLVAKKSDQPGCGKPTQMQHGTGMEEPANSLIPSHQGTEQDDQNDSESGKVPNPAVAIGETWRRLASSEDEGDPERYRSARIGDVVDGISEQRHATREVDHDEL